jgi:hypothetical protein
MRDLLANCFIHLSRLPQLLVSPSSSFADTAAHCLLWQLSLQQCSPLRTCCCTRRAAAVRGACGVGYSSSAAPTCRPRVARYPETPPAALQLAFTSDLINARKRERGCQQRPHQLDLCHGTPVQGDRATAPLLQQPPLPTRYAPKNILHTSLHNADHCRTSHAFDTSSSEEYLARHHEHRARLRRPPLGAR